MRYIADLHIHSPYSRATSKQLIPENLEYWAKIKGINVMGTGDALHPIWNEELKYKLVPGNNGFYKLKDEYCLRESVQSGFEQVGFVLTTEISSIYKKADKVRKVHSLVVLPDFKAVDKLYVKLSKIGNLKSDGRPILGLDARDLLEMVLEVDERAFVIPAHIWTPWFSVLGSKSGFDSLEECYEDLTKEIFAVETGLSSDPLMNRRCSFLDKFRLVSNSDAHSLEKLGREANLFDTEYSYNAMYEALKADNGGFLGTVEFFPEEGKYHWDGHRKCGVLWSPEETIAHKGLCSKCGKPVTKGVCYRVHELADRDSDDIPVFKQGHLSTTQLLDVLAQVRQTKSTSAKKVVEDYVRLVQTVGSELDILLFRDIEQIKEQGGSEILAEGIKRLRKGEVSIETGFDGEFGKISVFKPDEIKSLQSKQLFCFEQNKESYQQQKILKNQLDKVVKKCQVVEPVKIVKADENKGKLLYTAEQIEVLQRQQGMTLIKAGPGAGKTRVLTQKVIKLVKEEGVKQDAILAITFSNKAQQEMKQRIARDLPNNMVDVLTFHKFGLKVLDENLEKVNRKKGYYLIDEEEKMDLLKQLFTLNAAEYTSLSRYIENFKQGIKQIDEEWHLLLQKYDQELVKRNAFDLADLLALCIDLWQKENQVLKKYQEKYQWLLIDEFQDVNPVQYDIIYRLLTGSKQMNALIIGDPDQAIYGFRGAVGNLWKKIGGDFKNVYKIELSTSFRCASKLMKTAGQVLQKQDFVKGMAKEVIISNHGCITDKSEADYIALNIEKLMGGMQSFSFYTGISDGIEKIASFNDVAILCRSSIMFETIEKALIEHNIPYQKVAKPFYKSEPIKTLLHRLKLVFKHEEGEESIIDKEKMQKAKILINNKARIIDIFKIINENEASDKRYAHVVEWLEDYKNDYNEFWQDLVLNQENEVIKTKKEAVWLMSMHAAKGLEFKAVFIPGCENNLIPFQLFNNCSEEELAEEARLFYVALTRAEDYVFLTHVKKRSWRNRVLLQKKSLFLERIDKNLLEIGMRKNKRVIKQLGLFE
jgi:uncharacterized protein (TIGR00375 family)